ncbi:MAG TPA: hypothetical protein VGJ03_10280 [Acidimicrobiales bacterium]|jgi:hypothetical protein
MRRVCFIRFDLSDHDVSATAVGVGHRCPAECRISVSQGLELAKHYPMVVHDHANGDDAAGSVVADAAGSVGGGA